MKAMSVTVATEAARSALMGHKRQHFEVDPDDPEMQNKYKETRRKVSRISPQLFMKFVATHKEELKVGAQSAMVFWAVPKTNFPRGLPANTIATDVSAR